MVVMRPRRRQPWFRMLFVLVLFLGLVRHGEPSPTEKPTADTIESSSPESTSSTASSRDPSVARKFQDIGSPSELAWQAWLLVIAQPGAHRERNLDSATLLRRIYPKSIFWAPKRCSDGYHLDKNDNCVKNVNIDGDEHKKFIVHFLNDRFRNREAADSLAASSALSSLGNEQKKSSGPLKVNIPLITETEPPPPPKVEQIDKVEKLDSPEEVKNETAWTEPPVIEEVEGSGLGLVSGEEDLQEESGVIPVNGEDMQEDSQEALEVMIYEVIDHTASEEENSTVIDVPV